MLYWGHVLQNRSRWRDVVTLQRYFDKHNLYGIPWLTGELAAFQQVLCPTKLVNDKILASDERYC
jgi:hypothetical protein